MAPPVARNLESCPSLRLESLQAWLSPAAVRASEGRTRGDFEAGNFKACWPGPAPAGCQAGGRRQPLNRA
eukprot:746798-Hanusia_phi.AAC.1